MSDDKVFSSSSRFRPYEPVVFPKPIIGLNGAKLIAYYWAYEWTMAENISTGELTGKRQSDWGQAEISADTGRDIVHKFTVEMPDGEIRMVSSESVLILLGYTNRETIKSFPSLVTAVKTLAKQKMQLVLLEEEKKNYDTLKSQFEKEIKPEIKETEEQSDFLKRLENDESYTVFSMGDVWARQDNPFDYTLKKHTKISIPNKYTIEELTWKWVSKRVEELGGKYPNGLYDLKKRVERQERKVKEISEKASSESTKMAEGGRVEDFDYASLFDDNSKTGANDLNEELNKEDELEKKYQRSNFDKNWASSRKVAIEKTVAEYFLAKKTFEDWSGRGYKINKGSVWVGEELGGTSKNISSINESRRRRVLSSQKITMEDAIKTLKELGLSDGEINKHLNKMSDGGIVYPLTKDKVAEMLLYLDENGEHKLVSKYKGLVSDSDISSIIGAWATSNDSLETILEDYWKRHLKIEGALNSDKEMADGGEVEKSRLDEIKESVEQKLQKQQINKEFKDVGRVAQTRKEKSAYKLISGQLLTTLEEDVVMAYNMVKKENVWAEIDVASERERGVTSGAAYLKVKIREAAPTRPKDEKSKRATYVLFLEMLQKDLIECYSVKQIQDLRESYRYLSMDKIIGYFINPEFLTGDDEKKKLIEDTLKKNKNYGLAILYGGNYLVSKLIKEVFGAKFENIFFNKSDSAHVVWHDSKEKEPITEEESKALTEALLDRKSKFIEANNKLMEVAKTATKEELIISMKRDWRLSSETEKVYKANPEMFREWLVSYYERRIRHEEANWDAKEISFQPKANDWSWFETPKSRDVSELPKAKSINTKSPLAYIKRTGGYKIDINSPAEIIDKFGFSAVNYGVYVDDKWSREHTKHFLGAISDLAEMHNIDIKNLNKIGKLSIAFGAKGRKGHLATYFPQTKDINLTKGNGDGSIAHEWGHYFDNVIVELDEQRATNKFASDGSMPEFEIKVLFKELMDFFYKGNDLHTPKMPVNFYAKKQEEAPSYSKIVDGRWETFKIEIKPTIEETLEQVSHYAVIDQSAYKTQLRLFGYIIAAFGLESYSIPFKLKTSYFFHKSAYNLFQYCYKHETLIGGVETETMHLTASQRTPYWTSTVELFARAWETVVLKKLIDKGRMSNYLVSDISIEDVILESWSNPYPSGKELDYIEVMMDKIVIAVKRKFEIGDFIPPSVIIEDEYIDLAKDGKVEQEVIIDTAPAGEQKIEFVKDDVEIVVEKDPRDSKEYTQWVEWVDAISILEMLIESGGNEQEVEEWKDAVDTMQMLLKK